MKKDSRLNVFLRAAWEYIKTARLELIILAAAIAIDLVSKAIVGATMDLNDSVTLIPKFLHVTYIHNYAAAFGSSFGLDKLLGDNGVMILFIVISFVAVGFFGFFMYRNRGKAKMSRVAYALIIGGAVGNLVDRLAFGYVRDFIQFEYFGLTVFGSRYFAIFNFADSALCIGVALFAIYYIFIYKEPKKSVQTASDSDETAEKDIDEILDEDNELRDEAITSDPTDLQGPDGKAKTDGAENNSEDETDG